MYSLFRIKEFVASLEQFGFIHDRGDRMSLYHEEPEGTLVITVELIDLHTVAVDACEISKEGKGVWETVEEWTFAEAMTSIHSMLDFTWCRADSETIVEIATKVAATQFAQGVRHTQLTCEAHEMIIDFVQGARDERRTRKAYKRAMAAMIEAENN